MGFIVIERLLGGQEGKFIFKVVVFGWSNEIEV
jgi:hypothetical protein